MLLNTSNNKNKFSFKQPYQTAYQLGDYLTQKEQHYSNKSSRVVRDVQYLPHYISSSGKSKQYVPLGIVMEHAVLKKKELKYLNFQQIHLEEQNTSSLNKIVFKSNIESKQIIFYLPTFVRFNLLKLHSQDLKYITHIQNLNNLEVYINVYVKGLPSLFIQKLSKKFIDSHGNQQQPQIAFKANNSVFHAKYFTTHNDYLIFLFNQFQHKKVEFEILKNILYAPFQQAQLILNMHINKKIFKLQTNKNIKINHSKNQIQSYESILEFQFNKVVIQFKLQEPVNITDSFRYHKSIEHGNYGIMTNQVHIELGSQKAFKHQEEQNSLKDNPENSDSQDCFQHISSLRLSIGLYRHPIAQICTFFLPLMLAAGITLLLFSMCDHDLQNQLQVLAIVLVAYGSFIPQFRQRISLSRNVIVLDFFILYNSVPAILCAWQSALQSRSDGQYNIFHVISSCLYIISFLFLAQVYSCFKLVQVNYFLKNRNQMLKNFDTEIFQNGISKFKDNSKLFLRNFQHSQKQKVYFCFKEQSTNASRRKTKKLTLFDSTVSIIDEDQIIMQDLMLQIKRSDTNDKKIQQIDIEDDEKQAKAEKKDSLYKDKAIEGQVHVHSFNKLMTRSKFFILLIILLVSFVAILALGQRWLMSIYNFKDQNQNCIDDQQERYRQKVNNFIDAQIKYSEDSQAKQVAAYSWHHKRFRSAHKHNLKWDNSKEREQDLIQNGETSKNIENAQFQSSVN